jgi:hypothetical protein
MTWISQPRTTHETIALILARLVEEATAIIVIVEDCIILLQLYTPQPELQLELLYLSPWFRRPADSLTYLFALFSPKNRSAYIRRNDISIARNKDIRSKIT